MERGISDSRMLGGWVLGGRFDIVVLPRRDSARPPTTRKDSLGPTAGPLRGRGHRSICQEDAHGESEALEWPQAQRGANSQPASTRSRSASPVVEVHGPYPEFPP